MSSPTASTYSPAGWKFTTQNDGTTVSLVSTIPRHLKNKIDTLCDKFSEELVRLEAIEVSRGRVTFITKINPRGSKCEIDHSLDGLKLEIEAATPLPQSRPAPQRKRSRHGKRQTATMRRASPRKQPRALTA